MVKIGPNDQNDQNDLAGMQDVYQGSNFPDFGAWIFDASISTKKI